MWKDLNALPKPGNNLVRCLGAPERSLAWRTGSWGCKNCFSFLFIILKCIRWGGLIGMLRDFFEFLTHSEAVLKISMGLKKTNPIARFEGELMLGACHSTSRTYGATVLLPLFTLWHNSAKAECSTLVSHSSSSYSTLLWPFEIICLPLYTAWVLLAHYIHLLLLDMECELS